MRFPARRPVPLALLAASALALAACGGSGHGKGGLGVRPVPSASSATTSTGSPFTAAPTPTTPVPSATGSPTPSTSGSSAPPATPALRAIVLQAADLPSTWKGTPYQADPTTGSDQAALVRCIGGKNTGPDETGEADSADFDLGNATISSSASSYRSASDIAADTALLRSSKASACFESLTRKELPSSLPAGSKIGAMSFVFSAPAKGLPSSVVAQLAARIAVTVQGQTLTLYTDSAFIAHGLVEAEVDFEDVATHVPAGLQTRLVTLVATRSAR